jgi:hypothetical protein
MLNVMLDVADVVPLIDFAATSLKSMSILLKASPSQACAAPALM